MRVSLAEFVLMKNFFENEICFPGNITKESFCEECERIIREYYFIKDEIKGPSPKETPQDPQ